MIELVFIMVILGFVGLRTLVQRKVPHSEFTPPYGEFREEASAGQEVAKKNRLFWLVAIGGLVVIELIRLSLYSFGSMFPGA